MCLTWVECTGFSCDPCSTTNSPSFAFRDALPNQKAENVVFSRSISESSPAMQSSGLRGNAIWEVLDQLHFPTTHRLIINQHWSDTHTHVYELLALKQGEWHLAMWTQVMSINMCFGQDPSTHLFGWQIIVVLLCLIPPHSMTYC